MPDINEGFLCEAVAPAGMDWLWEHGWRHFGVEFFRYSTDEHESACFDILPLRIDLERFIPSKSQRRVVRRNADLEVTFAVARLRPEVETLFERHRTRFSSRVPDCLEQFLGATPERGPCVTLECSCSCQNRLLAVSYFDLGAASASSVFALFEPEEGRRSLGIFTLLMELEFCRRTGRRWLYPGYATLQSSGYDYKKQFAGSEAFDWRTECWVPLAQTEPVS